MHCSLFNALQNMRVYLFFLPSNQNPSTTHTHNLDILLSSNHNFPKSLHGISFWASDPLINRFLKNLSIKVSEAHKQRPCELLWMLWVDEKSISNLHTKKEWTFHSQLQHQLTLRQIWLFWVFKWPFAFVWWS